MVRSIVFRTALVAAVGGSSAAQAGQTACVAPEQAIASATQSQVDAEVAAQVARLGGGNASTDVSKTATNDTVLLTQDALARSWYLYQLCSSAQAKLISTDAYERIAASMAPGADTVAHASVTKDPAVFASADPAPATGSASNAPPAVSAAPAIDLDAMKGTWEITTDFYMSDCTNPSTGTDTFQWLVGRGADGSFAANVTGNTSFSKLAGSAAHGRIKFTGHKNGGDFDSNVQIGRGGYNDPVIGSTAYDVWLESSTALKGYRTVAMVEGPYLNTGTTRQYYASCTAMYLVHGRKM